MKTIIHKIQNHRLVKKFPTGVQMIKFALVGGMNFVIDFLVYVSLTRIFNFWREHYLMANLIAFSVAVTFSFFVNKKWTFRYRGSGLHQRYVQFFAVCLIGLLWTELILYTGVDVLHWHDVLVKFLAAFLVFFWNFGVNKFWTFRSRMI
jgi:putative flippase GtrA